VNIKPVVLIGSMLIIFSCNNRTGTKKEGYNKDNDKTVTAPAADDNNPNIKYLADTTDIPTLLCQGWEIEDDVNELMEADDNSKIVIPFRSFYISADGSFTKNPRNTMDYGKWKYDAAEKTITFYYTSIKQKDVYKIAALAPDELKLQNRSINTSTILKFISSTKVNKDPLQEPFHISNNRWRIKPSAPETDAAIRSRLKDNLHFFMVYYKDAIAKNPDFVSFYGLPSCLKWYSGGIFMAKEEELNPEWLKCFYNIDDAMKAYKTMGKVMDKKYTWPKDGSNWLQQNLSVLQQIYNNVDLVN